MCAIIGALLNDIYAERLEGATNALKEIWRFSHERGRDGRGFFQITERTFLEHYDNSRVTQYPETYPSEMVSAGKNVAWISNLRAEPTTEHVQTKQPTDQQPYGLGEWAIVHNGTIANDKDLRTYHLQTTIDSAAIVEQLASEEFENGYTGSLRNSFWHFKKTIQKLKGSFAILAINTNEPDHIMVATNYRPIWYCTTPLGVFFASSRGYLPSGYPREMVEPYTISSFVLEEGRVVISTLPLTEQTPSKRALVVCSGGLDSVVAATWAQKQEYDIELLNFQYGSRAEGPELKAVKAVAEALGVPIKFFPIPIYKPEDSPLLRGDSTIAGGMEGAEFAHEWVPARNLVMLSIATALAEAGGFDTIILGNNLEEAGAYPDNEPEFIAKFNDLLPFAVGDGKKVKVVMPVGNMMKHEIVALGLQLGAPLDRTWSCYKAGELHCGVCGPCFMRRTAFKINNTQEVIQYEV